ncbi:TMEM175 family protein [Parasediminibacterium paludis]|uniref:TMEM175 family protein n=1 Tax=Parasediminibacterium paludis TaxID=908966 RepID=A0ABV8Q253_9BACT
MTPKLDTAQQHHANHEKHPKQDFQVERLAFFSDAVFAIAITLLIIDIKVPKITKDSTSETVWVQLVDLRYSFFALLLSFTLIANYWIRHHFLFKHIHNYNRKTLIADMFVLLPIIFFPFTTAFFAESSENKQVIILALRLFLLNNILSSLAIYTFYWMAIIKHKEMSFEMAIQEKITFTSDTLFTTIIFLIILLITFITENFQIITWIIIISVTSKKIMDTLLKKRLKQ